MIVVNNKKIGAIFKDVNFIRQQITDNKVVFKENIKKATSAVVRYSKTGKTNNRNVGKDLNFMSGSSLALFLTNTMNFIGIRYTSTGGNAGRVLCYLSKTPEAPVSFELKVNQKFSYLHDPIFTIIDGDLKAVSESTGAVLATYNLSVGSWVALAGEKDKMFAIVKIGNSTYTLYRLNVTEGVLQVAITFIKQLDRSTDDVTEKYANLTFHDENLWSITHVESASSTGVFNHQLYSIDQLTGNRTLVGRVNLATNTDHAFSDMTSSSDKLYGQHQSILYEINKTTAASSEVASFGSGDTFSGIVYLENEMLSINKNTGVFLHLNLTTLVKRLSLTNLNLVGYLFLVKVSPTVETFNFTSVAIQKPNIIIPASEREKIKTIFSENNILEISINQTI